MKNAKVNKEANFQICKLASRTDGKKAVKVCVASRNVYAESLKEAYAEFGTADNIRIYPLASLADGESIVTLANYVYYKWERRKIANDAAVMSALKRTPHDIEDMTSDAILAIVATLTENPNANMYDTYKAAYAYLESKFRKEWKAICKTGELNPNYKGFTFLERFSTPCNPAVDTLIKKAVENCELSTPQLEVVVMVQNGIPASAIIERLAISRNAYYTRYYSAKYRLLSYAIDNGGMDIFAAAGYNPADILETLAQLKKQARIK